MRPNYSVVQEEVASSEGMLEKITIMETGEGNKWEDESGACRRWKWGYEDEHDLAQKDWLCWPEASYDQATTRLTRKEHQTNFENQAQSCYMSGRANLWINGHQIQKDYGTDCLSYGHYFCRG